MNKKISDKDKKDWDKFISSNEKIPNKDLNLKRNKIEKGVVRTIDLHGFTLDSANKYIEKFVLNCYENKVNKIIVITGKGLRSKNDENPYISKDLSILKNSVPEFIKSQGNLIKKIKKICEADIEDGGKGAFYIFLKKKE